MAGALGNPVAGNVGAADAAVSVNAPTSQAGQPTDNAYLPGGATCDAASGVD